MSGYGCVSRVDMGKLFETDGSNLSRSGVPIRAGGCLSEILVDFTLDQGLGVITCHSKGQSRIFCGFDGFSG
jgi:hypothetical protein